MEKKRLAEIDDIRGISIIVMVLIHTNVYFLKNALSYAMLEISQFAVVAFIFCSAYLFFLRKPDHSWRAFFSHLWKRVKRLVVPYYLFLAVQLFLFFLVSPGKITPAYVFDNLFLTGGIDFNWLVLLFIQLAVLMPFVFFLNQKRRVWYVLFAGITLISSIFFLWYPYHTLYRLVMWLPWSLILVYALHFDAVKKNTRFFIAATLMFLLVFIFSREMVLIPLHHSLRMQSNKYPPNIYHLAYSLFAVNILYFLSERGLFKPVKKIIHFFSINSYSIFFVHILVIHVLTVFIRIPFNWVTFFLTVLGLTAVVQMGINRIISFRR